MKVLVGSDDRILGFTMIGAEAGEVVAVVQTAMLGNLPYQRLRDAVISHPTMAEGLGPLLANVPATAMARKMAMSSDGDPRVERGRQAGGNVAPRRCRETVPRGVRARSDYRSGESPAPLALHERAIALWLVAQLSVNLRGRRGRRRLRARRKRPIFSRLMRRGSASSTSIFELARAAAGLSPRFGTRPAAAATRPSDRVDSLGFGERGEIEARPPRKQRRAAPAPRR